MVKPCRKRKNKDTNKNIFSKTLPPHLPRHDRGEPRLEQLLAREGEPLLPHRDVERRGHVLAVVGDGADEVADHVVVDLPGVAVKGVPGGVCLNLLKLDLCQTRLCLVDMIWNLKKSRRAFSINFFDTVQVNEFEKSSQ